MFWEWLCMNESFYYEWTCVTTAEDAEEPWQPEEAEAAAAPVDIATTAPRTPSTDLDSDDNSWGAWKGDNIAPAQSLGVPKPPPQPRPEADATAESSLGTVAPTRASLKLNRTGLGTPRTTPPTLRSKLPDTQGVEIAAAELVRSRNGATMSQCTGQKETAVKPFTPPFGLGTQESAALQAGQEAEAEADDAAFAYDIFKHIYIEREMFFSFVVT